MRNPFQEATPVAKKLKILFYGPSGSGKTLAALSFPRVAIVDGEGGCDLYAGRKGIQKFSIMRSKTVSDLRDAIKFIREDNGQSFDTLVIDPITVFYEVLKDATARSSKTGDLGFREWAKINATMKAVYNDLTALPVHVVVIGREAVEYEGSGGDLKKIGVKPDADKSLQYLFDFVVRFNTDHSAVVTKSRGAELGEQQRLQAVNWIVFEKTASAFNKGAVVEITSDETAIEAERLAAEFQDKEVVTQFFEKWYAESVNMTDILAALGISRAGEWKGGLDAANKAVHAHINALLQANGK